MITTADSVSVSDKTPIRLLKSGIAKSRSREISLCFRVVLKILTETSRWHCCRGASQISERWDNFKHKSQLRLRDFTGSYDETSYEGLIRYWNGFQDVSWWAVNTWPWTVNASRGFRSSFTVSSINVVSGVSVRKYGYHLFNATMRHPNP